MQDFFQASNENICASWASNSKGVKSQQLRFSSGGILGQTIPARHFRFARMKRTINRPRLSRGAI
jgi:hypothetical protein